MTAVESPHPWSAEHGPGSGRPQDFNDIAAAMREEPDTVPRRIEWVPLDQITEDPANPKGHDEDLISASVERHGVIDLMTRDDRTGYLISGHGRLSTLRARHAAGAEPPPGVQVTADGTWLAPVVVGWASKDDLDARAALITLNQATIAGGWVDDALLTALDQLREVEHGLDGVGFDEEDVESLRARLAAPPTSRTEPDDAPSLPSEEPISKRGDLWILGPHRLVCGDATNPDTIDLALGGGDAGMVWTDPPYGVSYVGKTADALTIANDALTAESLAEEILVPSFTLMREVLRPGGAFYICSPSGVLETTFRLALEAAGLALRQQIVWEKSSFVLGWSDYHGQHETVLYGWQLGGEPQVPPHYDPEHDTMLYGWNEGAKRTWHGGRKQSTVWSFPKPNRSDVHPTMKPVALVQRAIANSCPNAGIVLDPFAGSGSTLIAAHAAGRAAALVELDPRYADVICRRYQEHTGVLPVRDGIEHDFTRPAASRG